MRKIIEERVKLLEKKLGWAYNDKSLAKFTLEQELLARLEEIDGVPEAYKRIEDLEQQLKELRAI